MTSLLVALIPVLALSFGAGPEKMLVLVGSLGLLALGLEWEVLVSLLIGVTFFVGPLKIGYGGWLVYAIPDLLAALILLRWVAGQLLHGKGLIQGHPLGFPFVSLTAYLLLELFNPSAPLIRSLLGLRSWLLYTIFIFVGYASFRSVVQIERLYRVLILMGVLTAAYGILQWQKGPAPLAALGGLYIEYLYATANPAEEQFQGSQVFRAFSTFTSATGFATNMAFVILVAVSFVLSRRSRGPWKAVYLGSIVLMASAIETTGSRMGPVYLTGAVLAMGYLFPSAKVLFLAVPLGLLSMTVGRAITRGFMVHRFESLFEPEIFFWKWYIPLESGLMRGVNNPFGEGLGYAVGLPAFAGEALVRELPAGSTNTIDSGYGIVAAELGIIGLPLFVWFAVALALAAHRAWRTLSPESRPLFLAPAIWGVTFPVFTILGAPHASLPASVYLWLLIGMLLRAGQMKQAGRENGR